MFKNVIKKQLKNRLLKLQRQDVNSVIASLPVDLRFGLVDIGSAGAIQSKWLHLKPYIEYIGFEPDKRSFDELEKQDKGFHKYKILNVGLWSKRCIKTLNLCRKTLVSSIYNPNLKLLKKYRNPSRFDVIDSKFIDLDSLDNALSDIGFRQDYIKLDIQGAELEVLKGSTQTLKNAFFVEVEVEFREIYLDQPLFGDVSKFLEDENFIFTDFLSTAKYYRQQNNYGGDLIFADALFMKDPTEINFDEDFDLESVNAYIFILFLTKKYDALKYIEEMSKKYSILCKFDCFFKVVNKIIHKENKLMRRMWNAL